MSRNRLTKLFFLASRPAPRIDTSFVEYNLKNIYILCHKVIYVITSTEGSSFLPQEIARRILQLTSPGIRRCKDVWDGGLYRVRLSRNEDSIEVQLPKSEFATQQPRKLCIFFSARNFTLRTTQQKRPQFFFPFFFLRKFSTLITRCWRGLNSLRIFFSRPASSSWWTD